MVGLPVGSGYDAAMGRGGGGRAGSSSKVGGGGEPAGSSAGYGGKAHGGGGKYRECLKNHAVGIGGHAVDGCGEFMAAGEDGSLDALRCAACGCHRNFHRKDVVAADEAAAAAVAAGYHPHFTPYYQTPYLHHHYPAAALVPPAPPPHQYPQQRLALPSTSGGGGHFREETEEDVWNSTMVGGSVGGRGAAASASGVRKRFRTKFTAEQKEKMLAFAEWVGWRIPKHEEAAVQKFCEETSIKRHVLKVWMHNNKHTLAKKP